MARILIPNPNGENEWYEQVGPMTFSEIEIEGRIILHAPIIYPEFHVLPFKQTVESSAGSKKADLIFIARDYSDWWVCEIELGHKSLNDHVEPQVRVLTEANYGAKEVACICKNSPELQLDYEKTLKLIEGVPAKVLVILNEPKKEWIKTLKKHNALIGVFELFRSEKNNDEIFRVNGEYPSRYIGHISKCFIHPTASRLLGILSPDALNLPKHGRIVLRYNNCITEWVRVDAEGKVWLSPTGQPFLDKGHEYEIYRQGDDALVLRRYPI